MTRRRPTLQTPTKLTEEINRQLTELGEAHDQLDLREKVLRLIDLRSTIDNLGIATAKSHGINATGARGRIKEYLIRYTGTVIDGNELAVVSGISEYARRVRELRVEQGYRIITGNSADTPSGVTLRPDQYLLLDPEPDTDLSRRWHVANRIRRDDTSTQERILAYLIENEGHPVTTEELAYVSRNRREFGRRTRELRTEKGYAIATRFSGRPDLRIGEYVLLSRTRIAEKHDRHIKESVQRAVYERDRHTCQNPACNYTWSPDDQRLLELHHITEHRHGGPNTAENLIVLCSRCHDDLHAGRLVLPSPPNDAQ